jgi:hypothetical protein
MSKKFAFKILIVLWALALVLVGIFKYKNSRSCTSCKLAATYRNELTIEQTDKLKNRLAVLLFPDNADPIYIDEDNAYSHPAVSAFSTVSPELPTEDEVKLYELTIQYRKIRDSLPEELQALRLQRKLAILRTADNKFFMVALSASLQND